MALLHLLTCLETGKPLPDLDQGYYQVLLSVVDEWSRSVKATEHQALKEELIQIFNLLPRSITQTPPNIPFPTTTFAGAKQLQNGVARQMATMTRNSVILRFWGLLERKLKEKIKLTYPDLKGKEVEEVTTQMLLIIK